MKKFVLFFAALIVLSSCKILTPLSTTILQKEKLPIEKLKKVQYYSGEGRIILERVITNEEKSINSGIIISRDGQEIEQIVFKRFTKGILLSSDSSSVGFKLKICFEERDSAGIQNFLTFGPVKDKEGLFVLYCTKKKDNFYTYYGKYIYKIILEEDNSNLLFVDLRQFKNLKVTKRKVTGLIVGDNSN